MADLEQRLQSALDERERSSGYRKRRISDSPQQVDMVIDGREVINFCSNDYLGLANDPRLKRALQQGVDRWGVGSGAAHLVNGHTSAHHELEEALADFSGYPRALLFSTGYMANIGVCQALLDKTASVYEDRLNHASLIDGGLISSARFQRYPHLGTDALANILSRDTRQTKLVLSDGVFSMDGDIADLAGLQNACTSHEATLMIDDAHGFGVLGENGRGIIEQSGIRPPIYMATLGKALGVAGAFVAANETIIETLIQQARTNIYTTAQPAALAVATLESLKVIDEEPERRQRLHDNIAYFRRCADTMDIAVQESTTAIQPIIIGDTGRTVEISDALFERGIHITAIRPPTVPDGSARLRITLTANHERSHIDQLISTLRELIS